MKTESVSKYTLIILFNDPKEQHLLAVVHCLTQLVNPSCVGSDTTNAN